jgi:hypothetical protein
MKTIKKLMSVMATLFLAVSVTSCGSASGTVDPLSLFNDSSIPQLDPIINSGYAFTSGQAFSANSPYWVFTNGSAFGQSYVAPAKGIVTSIGTATFGGITGPYITIVHSGRLATRIIGISPFVRSGDSVISGQQIGTVVAYGLSSIAFQVLLDGTPVCPISYLSTAFRTQFLPYFSSVNSLCN